MIHSSVQSSVPLITVRRRIPRGQTRRLTMRFEQMAKMAGDDHHCRDISEQLKTMVLSNDAYNNNNLTFASNHFQYCNKSRTYNLNDGFIEDADSDITYRYNDQLSHQQTNCEGKMNRVNQYSDCTSRSQSSSISTQYVEFASTNEIRKQRVSSLNVKDDTALEKKANDVDVNSTLTSTFRSVCHSDIQQNKNINYNYSVEKSGNLYEEDASKEDFPTVNAVSRSNVENACKATPVTHKHLHKRIQSVSSSTKESIHFSPAGYDMALCAGEQVVIYERNETGNLVKSKRDVVSRDPLAISTPLMQSSESERSNTYDPASRVINRSGISTITAFSTAYNAKELEMEYLSQIKRLNEGVRIEGERNAQACTALTVAVNFNSGRKSTATLAELCAHREILLSRERYMALFNELERIKMLYLIKKPIPRLSPSVLTTFEISSIVVRLNHNFSIMTDEESDKYAFVVVMKGHDQVYATEAVTPIGGRTTRDHCVRFTDTQTFRRLPLEFTVVVEVYIMKLRDRIRTHHRSCAILRNKARSILNEQICISNQSVVNESAINSSEFTLCGNVLLNRDAVGTKQFYMDNVQYPLDGVIEIKSNCSNVPKIIDTEFNGFLTMYKVELETGEGAWIRYWAVLRRGVVRFWERPNDYASNRTPIACMDLTKCINSEVRRTCLHKVCSSSNTFSVDLLLSKGPSVIEKKRVLLSADTKAKCTAWIDAINETLSIIRA